MFINTKQTSKSSCFMWQPLSLCFSFQGISHGSIYLGILAAVTIQTRHQILRMPAPVLFVLSTRSWNSSFVRKCMFWRAFPRDFLCFVHHEDLFFLCIKWLDSRVGIANPDRQEGLPRRVRAKGRISASAVWPRTWGAVMGKRCTC